MDNIIANKVALRYEALFIDIDSQQIKQHHEPTTSALTLVSRLSKFGYSVEQDLLQAFLLGVYQTNRGCLCGDG